MKLSRDRINVMMARNELTVMKLAERYGVSRARMNIIINSQNLTPACVGRLAKALGVDVTELIES